MPSVVPRVKWRPHTLCSNDVLRSAASKARTPSFVAIAAVAEGAAVAAAAADLSPLGGLSPAPPLLLRRGAREGGMLFLRSLVRVDSPFSKEGPLFAVSGEARSSRTSNPTTLGALLLLLLLLLRGKDLLERVTNKCGLGGGAVAAR